MSRLGDLLDAAREGAADLLGLGDELAELREAKQDLRMMVRGVERLRDSGLGGQASPQEPDRLSHRELVEQGYLYYFYDPNVRRIIDLQTLYVFAAGVATPRYRDDPKTDEDDEHVTYAIRRIEQTWDDERNRACITGVLGQHEKSLELQVQANVFFHVLPGDPDDGPLAHFSDLPEDEVVDVITHPADGRVPLYYVRHHQPRRWRPGGPYDAGAWEPAGQPTITFYRHLTNEAPDDGTIEVDGQEIQWTNPPSEKIAEGRVLHVAVNKHSRMRFGISEMASIVPFARSLSRYLTSRLNTIQALAQIAMQVQTSGGQRSVSQASRQLRELQRLASEADEGRTGRDRERALSGPHALVSGKGTEVKPVVTDTGAHNAKGDIETMRGQLSVGSGIPRTHLGSEPGPLAGSIAQDRPLSSLITARQTLWRDGVLLPLMRYALEQSATRLDPARLEIVMPAISDRDAGTTAEILRAVLDGVLGMLARPEPEAREMARFLLGEVLDAMGKEQVEELVEHLVPKEPVVDANMDGVDDADEPNRGGGLEEELDHAASRERAGGLRQADELADPAAETGQRGARAERRVQQALEAARDHEHLSDDELAVIVEGALDGVTELLEQVR